ncbi:NAD(P)(+) transhydrogenase (Re/Si-specific) subunit beta [Roseobacter sp. SK209-2-6]|uniref:NAD(P)(+) transhydrogenase (Re/Si-specific) subunit beta n=1 Tax=Roseobacter sp. SK209-2-6 TaxID=388739 RepID=UPI0002F8FEB3
MSEQEIAIVFGSKDIADPMAQDASNKPIGGMPVLEYWKAKQMFVSRCRRSSSILLS